MSKFLGITFADQNVQPSDDAAVRRAALSDGFLYGCELSYAGSTLTMASGQIIACGRQFEHPTSDNWAVVDATSGYARLLLTIDLSRTSTEDAFDQVTDTIEYATSVDGFPVLEQEDINTSGLRYQVVACVVSLGTGGITGIVEQIGRSYARPPLKLVWELPSGVSSMSAGKLTLTSGKYAHYLVDFGSNDYSIIVRSGRKAYGQRVFIEESTSTSATRITFYSRMLTFPPTGSNIVTIEDARRTYYTTSSGWLKTETSNATLVPHKIWGIEGV